MGFGSEEVYTQAYVPTPTQTSMVVAAQVSLRYETWGLVVIYCWDCCNEITSLFWNLYQELDESYRELFAIMISCMR